VTDRKPLPDGPRYPTVLHVMSAVRRDPLGFFEGLWREWGDIVFVRAPPLRPAAFAFRPEAIERVFVTNHRNYWKGQVGQMIAGVVGQSTAFADGDEWLRRRRLVQPAVRGAEIARLSRPIGEAGVQLAAEWERRLVRAGPSGEVEFDALAEMKRITFWIAGHLFFGCDLDQDAPEFATAVATFFQFVTNLSTAAIPLPLWMRIAGNREFRKARRTTAELIRRIMASRAGAQSNRVDLLSRLLAARDEDGSGRFSEEEVREEVFGFLIAGHETTALALTWTLHLIAEYPEVQERLATELDQVLGGEPPGYEHLEKLPFTQAVIQEALRLYPPIPQFLRQSHAEDEWCGYFIPERTPIFVSASITHRHPDYWSNPNSFLPERFLATPAEPSHRAAYFPFGMGARACIGRELSLVESRLLLASLIQRFRVSPQPHRKVQPELVATLRPRGGLPLRIARRAHVA